MHTERIRLLAVAENQFALFADKRGAGLIAQVVHADENWRIITTMR